MFYKIPDAYFLLTIRDQLLFRPMSDQTERSNNQRHSCHLHTFFFFSSGRVCIWFLPLLRQKDGIWVRSGSYSKQVKWCIKFFLFCLIEGKKDYLLCYWLLTSADIFTTTSSHYPFGQRKLSIISYAYLHKHTSLTENEIKLFDVNDFLNNFVL